VGEAAPERLGQAKEIKLCQKGKSQSDG